LTAAQARGIEIHRLTSQKPTKNQPVIRFENVADGLIQSCKAVEGTGTFLELKGTGNSDISMIANRLSRAAVEIGLVDGASESAVVKK